MRLPGRYLLAVLLPAAILAAGARLLSADSVSPAAKWRDQTVAKLEALIQQATEKDLALLTAMQERGGPTKEITDQRKELATQRTTARKQVAALKNLKGTPLEKAYQAELRAEAEKKERAAEERRNAQTLKANQKRDAANLRQARLLFGNDVELAPCDQCVFARLNGGCGKCGNTGLMPVR